MAKQLLDLEEIRKTLTILKPNKQVFEIRMMDSNKNILSGYFDDIELAIKDLRRVMGTGWQVYITLNEIDSSMKSRTQFGKIQKLGKNPTTSKKDVVGYDWLFIDLDPDRSTGVSSSDEELESTKELGNKVYKFMEQLGFEKPITAFSGNGVHLLYKIYLSNNEINEKIISDAINTLNMLFSNEKIKIDVANKDPNRICKLYGTLAQKGRDTEERPHRMSKMTYYPTEIKATDIKYLHKLIDLQPKMDERQRYNNYNPGEFDLEQWLSDHMIRYKTAAYDGGTKYILECCPFDNNHNGKDACVFRGRSGALGFKCLHNSCADKTWKDFRMFFEPDAYEKKQREYEERIYRSYNRDKKVEKKPIVEKEGNPVFYTAIDIYNMPKQDEEFIKTGITDIDMRLRGLKKGYVSAISGLRASSKSTVLSQIILKAIDEGNNVDTFSGELTARNFMRWMNLQAAGKGYVEPTQYEGYYTTKRETNKKIADWLSNHFWLYNNDYGNDFEQILKQFESSIDKHGTDLLILDNLMAFNISSLSDNKWDAQTQFVLSLQKLAKSKNVHIIFVAHPRKAMGFLRLDDISGTGDLANAVDNAFIVHRVNNDFKRLSKQMFGWKEDSEIYEATNCIEIAKDRDGGICDYFVPLYYEKETKRLKNNLTENVIYGWNKDSDGFYTPGADEETPFDFV